MSNFINRSLLTAGAIALVALGVAVAQPGSRPFEPTVDQTGKDVVWVPSPQALVDRMLDMAKVTPKDFLVDLGSGDGRTVITATKRGVKARGIEYNPDMVALSRRNAAAQDAPNAEFVQGDIFQSDFSNATVVTMFLLPALNLRLRPQLLEMRPGTRLVSNTFDMGDWTPDQEISASSDCTSYCRAMLWIVPAKVGGTWKMAGGALTLTQQYQMLSGTLNGQAIGNGRMNGSQITFTAGGRTYTGTVKGNTMSGSGWSATRG